MNDRRLLAEGEVVNDDTSQFQPPSVLINGNLLVTVFVVSDFTGLVPLHQITPFRSMNRGTVYFLML